jgi:4-hydroxy-tetrahydrodipicolinate reductase
MTPYRVAVVGCAGRMGRMNLATIQATEGCVIAGGSDQPGSPAIGRDIGSLIGAGALGVTVGDDPVELFAKADAVIDFTVPAATRRHAELAAQAELVYVVGTTGLTAEDQAVIDKAAIQTVVVQAANMSLGVNLLQLLTEQVARAPPLHPACRRCPRGRRSCGGGASRRSRCRSRRRGRARPAR